jgi:type VI protein secretion system component Hcp
MSQSHGTLFLKLDDVNGDATAEGFEKQIVVKSYRVGMSTGRSKSTTGNVTITAMDLVLSGEIAHSGCEYCAGNNKVIKKGTLTKTAHDGDNPHKKVKTIEMENIMIISMEDFGFEGMEGLDFPLSLTYTESNKEAKSFEDDGSARPTAKLKHKVNKGVVSK